MDHNIMFRNSQEQQDYWRYLEVRGEGVYQMVYTTLCLYTGSSEINGSDFLGLIRYDKRLRDRLYVFLATLEEYLKNCIWRHLDCTGTNMIRNLGKAEKARITVSDGFGYNLFKHSCFDFNTITAFIREFRINPYGISDDNLYNHIENVRILRNTVMHHVFLTIDPRLNNCVTQIDERLRLIQRQILSLYMLLPPNWKQGFVENIRNANNTKEDLPLSRYLVINIEV